MRWPRPSATPHRPHLESNAVTSQTQLSTCWRRWRVATQATVSRDLEEIGAVKVRVPGGDTSTPSPAARTAWRPRTTSAGPRRLVVEVSHSANLVVLRTPPGSAHVVASALDRAGLDDVIDTVAGDDTIMVVASERAGGVKVAKRLSALAGL